MAQTTPVLNPRALWREAYRRTRAGDLRGAALFDVVAELTGARDVIRHPRGPVAMALQRGLENARRPPTPLRVQLLQLTLNDFGRANPWRLNPAFGRPSRVRSGRGLAARLKARGLLLCDAGGWARRLLPPELAMTADDFIAGRPVAFTARDGRALVAIHFADATGPRSRRRPPGVTVQTADLAAVQHMPMNETDARRWFAELPDPRRVDVRAFS